jgi:signal transduction histidine kinase
MVNPTVQQIRALLARQQLLNQQQHKYIARKIHDEISQKMTLLALQLSLATSDDHPPADWATKCKDWSNLVMELGDSIRGITNELQPRILDEFGLPSALRWLAQSSAGNVSFTSTGTKKEISLEPFAANELFSITREVVVEIFRTAKAARVEIELAHKDREVRLRLRIGDNRPGVDPITDIALEDLAIPDRLHFLDGSVELTYSAEAGSVITLTVPATRAVACDVP